MTPHTPTENLRIEKIRTLLPPNVLEDEMPMTPLAEETVLNGRLAASQIFSGKDDRLLVVIGPCSIHDTEAALDYAKRLKKMQQLLCGEVKFIMRGYLQKPRTVMGWKGFIYDPDINDTFKMNDGLRKSRELFLKINEMGMPLGTEFLDVITPQYTAGLIAWGAIGARTTESQVHRELASGLSMPVGFKNGTDGNIQIALDAISSASKPHVFLSVTEAGSSAIVHTKGNELCHLILRGGNGEPNYSSEHVKQNLKKLGGAGLHRYLMIDASHGNSKKDYKRQPEVISDIAAQIRNGEHGIAGVMIESFIVEGAQKPGPRENLTYGQSITDACVSWETTVTMLKELADAVRARRMASA